jgi:hypothetical protein
LTFSLSSLAKPVDNLIKQFKGVTSSKLACF